MALTDKQQTFCEEYMIDLNATQAARRAGYSERTAKQIGTENLSKPAIQETISALMAERSAETKIDAAYVIKNLTTIVERCLQQEAPVDDEGDPIEGAEFKFDPSPANKSLELIGKNLAMFTDNVNNKHSLDMSELSMEELLVIKARRKV